MKRKEMLRSRHHLARMHKRALGKPCLPPVFSQAVELMASKGIHPKIFRDWEPVRKITICPAMKKTGFKGVYFGYFSGRHEFKYPEDQLDWTEFGWNLGHIRCMIYPEDEPELWVVLHEFGHYIDDVYFCNSFAWFVSQDCDKYRIARFLCLRADMQTEFETMQTLALETVTDEQKEHRNWYQLVDGSIVSRAPSSYALLNYSEWVAEAFRRYYMESDDYLQTRCPSTYEFLTYALQGEVFHRKAAPSNSEYKYWLEDPYVKEGVSFSKDTPLTYKGFKYRTWKKKVEIVQAWSDDSVTEVEEECPPPK